MSQCILHLRGICSILIKLITSKLWEAPHQCCLDLDTLALESGSCLQNRHIAIWPLAMNCFPHIIDQFMIDQFIIDQFMYDRVLPSGQTGVAPSVHVAVLESLHCPWWGLYSNVSIVTYNTTLMDIQCWWGLYSTYWLSDIILQFWTPTGLKKG